MDGKKINIDSLSLEEACQVIYKSTPDLCFCELDKCALKNYAPHTHPYIELVCCINGKSKVAYGESNANHSLYDMVVHPAHKKHQDEINTDQSKEVIVLWIDVPELTFDNSIYLYEHNSILKQVVEQVYREAKRDIPDTQYLEYAIKILLVTVVRMQKQNKRKEQLLDLTMDYLKEHFAEGVTMEELAALEHVSTSYLSRKFKQRTGVTVITYINQLRVEKAQQLLMASTQSIDEIAYQTGFDSPKYFYRVFKSITGDSPASFRRKYKHFD